MSPDERSRLARRLRTTFDLHRFGVRMMRQNLRRRNPEAPEDEIAELLRDWMRRRPGAESGDSPGSPRPLAR